MKIQIIICVIIIVNLRIEINQQIYIAVFIKSGCEY